jgi:dihydrofolate reductase
MDPVPKLSLIAALADNGVIGRDNGLPWRLPADLAHFKRLTLGKPIVMGRRTWESLPGLLPQRRHIVITGRPDYRAHGAEVVGSPDAAIALLADAAEIMVVGGAQIYGQLLPRAVCMYLTRVHAEVDGDARFPDYDPAQWIEVDREDHAPDAKNPHPYSFVELHRVRRDG